MHGSNNAKCQNLTALSLASTKSHDICYRIPVIDEVVCETAADKQTLKQLPKVNVVWLVVKP